MKFYRRLFVIVKKIHIFAKENLSCPDGGTGRRTGLKIQRRKACRFDSGSGYNYQSVKHYKSMFYAFSFNDFADFCQRNEKPQRICLLRYQKNNPAY